MQRARKVERFLSQPFHVAEQFTGTPGAYVPIAETIRGFKEIIEGKHDELPERAFLLKGTIDDVVAAAKRLGGRWRAPSSRSRSSPPRARSSTTRSRWSRRARATGSIGILANHTPLLAMLDPTELRLYRSESEIVRYAQGEGYLQVADEARADPRRGGASARAARRRATCSEKLRAAEDAYARAEEGSEEQRLAARDKRRWEAFQRIAERATSRSTAAARPAGRLSSPDRGRRTRPRRAADRLRHVPRPRSSRPRRRS